MTSIESTRFGLVLMLWAAGLGAAAQFAKFSVIFPSLRELYPDAGTNLGFVVSIISLVGIVLGTTAGMFVARIGFRRLLLLALLLGAAVSAYQATLPSFALMLASRVVEGLSHLVIVVAAPTLIAQVSAQRHRPFTLTLWGTFFGVAFAIVAWLGVPLVSTHGMHMLFVAHAVALTAIALVLFIQLPKIVTTTPDRLLPGFRELLRRHADIYASPSMAAPAFGWVFYTLTYVSLLTLLPDTVAADDRAFVIGTMPLAGIASSMTLGIALLRRFSAVQVIMIGFAFAMAIGLWLGIDPGNPYLCIALFCALGLVQGASFAVVPQLNSEPATQAYANGAIAQMGNIGNTCGTPLLLAILVTFGFGGVMVLVIGCYGLGILVHFVLQRRRAALAV
ncbi:MAG: MFS transporter [Hyphomicrobiales bacterium]|nr:MFS transporter [Hyphomicrobiales bacterium]MCP5000117.1 MFS transporter [Hyphomicrobiales bacterium]